MSLPKKFVLAVMVGAVMACGIPNVVPSQTPIVYNGPRDRWALDQRAERTLVGIASWYPAGSWYTRKTIYYKGTRFYAAAGYDLRKLIKKLWPDHRYWHYEPVMARVTNPKTKKSIIVAIADECGCYSGTMKDRSDDKLIDLSPEAFHALGPSLGRGIQKVIVELLP